jgi:8-oxo-dGTP diphosphatase
MLPNVPPATEIVVAAVIVDDRQRLLIAQRPEGKFMPGWWEFPGGKLEYGEPPEAALVREVREELDIDIEVDEPLHVVNVLRPGRAPVLVIFYWCRWVGGEIRLLDAAGARWVSVEELRRTRYLESNQPVVEKLRRLPVLASGGV